MNANQSLKFLSKTLLMLMVALTTQAASLSPEQALQRIESSNSTKRIPGNKHFVLNYTEKTAGENVLYIFNNGSDGFILASADDCMPPVLGYSENGSFDYDNASPEFKWWLSQYAAEYEYIIKNPGSRNYTYTLTRSAKQSIPPLLSTQWNQGYPYNLLCPQDAGGRCVTGCVATAMAQVIKYYEYPSVGTGSHSYSWNGQTLSFDYANTVFDYSKMRDTYTTSSTQTQREAVANLMYACGVGVEMNYSSNESSASSYAIMRALKDYFNYDPDMQYLERTFFSNDIWNDKVYSELEEGRPVLYRGASAEGGHMFVCDGFEDDYYHINWGWGGYCDGWFLLSALNPDGQGIGGFEGGYNLEQGIICGAQPHGSGASTEYAIFASAGFEVSEYNNSYALLTFVDKGGVWNYSPNQIVTPFYLQAFSADGEEYLSQGVDLTFKASDTSTWGFSGISLYLPKVGEGDYKVYVVFDGPQGHLQALKVPLAYRDYLNMRVDAAGNVSFYDESEPQPNITVTKLSPVSDVVSRVPTDFQISIFNTSQLSYSGTIFIKCYEKGKDVVVKEQALQVSLHGGQSINETFNMTFDIDPGDYELCCFDMFGNPISEFFPLTVLDNPEVVKLVVTDFQPTEDIFSGQPTVFQVSIRNEGSVEYSDDIKLMTYEHGSDTPIYRYSISMNLKPGQSVSGTLTLTYDLPGGEYDFRFFDSLGNQCGETFTYAIIDDNTPSSSLWVTDLANETDVYSGLPAIFNLSLRNESKEAYSGELNIVAYIPDSDEPVYLIRGEVNLDPGENSSFRTYFTFDLPAGDYEIYCFDKDGNLCSQCFLLTIKDQSESPKILVSDFKQLSEVVSGKPAKFSLAVENIGSVVYHGAVYIDAYKHNTGESLDYAGFTLDLNVGDRVEGNIELTFDLPDGEYDIMCSDMFDRPCSDVFSLTIGKLPDIKAAAISLDRNEATLEVGETLTLTATVTPDDTSNKTVAWSSSDDSIATVDQEGNVSVLAVGSVVITAATTDGSDLKAECLINAVSSVSSIQMNPENADIYTIDGVLIKKGAEPEWLKNLENGTYILHTPKETIKIIKR